MVGVSRSVDAPESVLGPAAVPGSVAAPVPLPLPAPFVPSSFTRRTVVPAALVPLAGASSRRLRAGPLRPRGRTDDGAPPGLVLRSVAAGAAMSWAASAPVDAAVGVRAGSAPAAGARARAGLAAIGTVAPPRVSIGQVRDTPPAPWPDGSAAGVAGQLAGLDRAGFDRAGFDPRGHGGDHAGEAGTVVRRTTVPGSPGEAGGDGTVQAAGAEPPGRTGGERRLARELATEDLDELVDLVVERIEQRVLDELERRGRRGIPGIF